MKKYRVTTETEEIIVLATNDEILARKINVIKSFAKIINVCRVIECQ